nr:hypothetical protein [Burkholderia ambifaria]
MAPILPERRRAPASARMRRQFRCAGARPSSLLATMCAPSHRDVMNKKSARRGTDTKTVRVVASTKPCTIGIVRFASIQ